MFKRGMRVGAALVMIFVGCGSGGGTLQAATSKPTPAAPRVALFAEPTFPHFNVPATTSPQRVKVALATAGVPADLLDAAALADPQRFNRRRYAALVMPYGNVYPEAAFANLRAFHHAGGNLILSAVPFTHAVRRTENEGWRDVGHNADTALFGSEGIGVGGFLPSASGKAVIAPGDPLGLKGMKIDWGGGDRVQPLDTKTLPPTVAVEPALVVGTQPLATLLVHNGGPFKGAVDVWTTQGAAGSDKVNAWLTEQLLARGTLASLARSGQLPRAQMAKAWNALNRLPRPHLYANLTLPKMKRPYPTLQPKQNPPARHLLVADAQKLSHDEQLLLATLQGLVNRTQPRIYLIWREDDRFWLDEMVKRGQTDAPTPVADPLSLLKTFRSSYQGAVVPDPKVNFSPALAANIAAVDNLLIATPKLAKRLDIPVKEDLRGRFKDNAEALRYLRTTLLPRLNPFLAICLDPPLLGAQMDYIIANKGVTFWITGPRAQDRPGANMQDELEEVEALLAAMPLNAVVHGFWWHGEGIGLDEGPGVALGSRFGKITTVSDYVANYSVTSGVPLPALKQKPQPPTPPLDRSKVYIALTVSDGDNLVTWRDFFRGQFNDPLHGTFPIAWGMAPSLIDVSPVQAQWFYDHAAPTDEFICDVSGAGYIDNTEWATALKDRRGALASFGQLTEDYMKRMDMKTVRFMRPGVTDILEAGQVMKGVDFFMPDYGNGGIHDYARLTYTLPTGQAVFRALTDSGAEGRARQIRERVGTTRPAFVNAFVTNWGMSLAEIKAMLDALGPEVVAVTPSQLNALYRQSRKP